MKTEALILFLFAGNFIINFKYFQYNKFSNSNWGKEFMEGEGNYNGVMDALTPMWFGFMMFCPFLLFFFILGWMNRSHAQGEKERIKKERHRKTVWAKKNKTYNDN